MTPSIRYACLELRFTIEAVVYEKMRTYSARLPQEILETWQPPQVLRTLREFEPNSTENFVLYHRREGASDEDGSFEPRLKATNFNSASCESIIQTENRLLEIGIEFRCESCGVRHKIASRQWEYGMLAESSAATEGSE